MNKVGLSDVVKGYQYCRPIFNLYTAIKYWICGLNYLGTHPSQETMLKLIGVFDDFVNHNDSCVIIDSSVAMYLEALEFVTERIAPRYYKVNSPLIDDEKTDVR